MADVSISALEIVKSALSAFQSDISGISFRATQQSQNCLNACNQKITECQAKIQELDDEIDKLNAKIESLDEQISSAYAQIQKIENELPIMERRLKSIAAEITQLQKELSALQARLAETEDSEKRQEIQAEINSVNQQIRSLRQEQSDLEYQIQRAERTKAQLRQKINDMKSEKAKCEQALAIAKKRRNQYQDKYERIPDRYLELKTPDTYFTMMEKMLHSRSRSRSSQDGYHLGVSFGAFLKLIASHMKDCLVENLDTTQMQFDEEAQERVLDAIMDDLSFMADEAHIEISLSILDNALVMSQETFKDTTRAYFGYSAQKESVVVSYDRSCYLYKAGLFKEKYAVAKEYQDKMRSEIGYTRPPKKREGLFDQVVRVIRINRNED